MSKEAFWLTLTLAITGLIWIPYILDRMMVRGMMGTLANPSPADAPQTAWAQRMMAAHTNAVENLVVFAPLVLTWATYRGPLFLRRRAIEAAMLLACTAALGFALFSTAASLTPSSLA